MSVSAQEVLKLSLKGVGLVQAEHPELLVGSFPGDNMGMGQQWDLRALRVGP